MPANASRTPADGMPSMAEPAMPLLSLAAIYARHHREVCRWAAVLGGSAIDAQDVAQEVFLVVQRRLPEFRGDDPAPWLYAITLRVTRAARRGAWVRRWLFGASELLDDLEAPGPTPLDEAERRRSQETVYRLLGQLSTKRRTAFALFEIAGHTAEEIARLQGVPAATIRTRLFEARRDFVRLAGREQRREGRRAGKPGGAR